MFIFHGSLTWVSGILKEEEVIILLYYHTLTGGMDPSKSLVLLKIQINTRVSFALLQKQAIPPLCNSNSHTRNASYSCMISPEGTRRCCSELLFIPTSLTVPKDKKSGFWVSKLLRKRAVYQEASLTWHGIYTGWCLNIRAVL